MPDSRHILYLRKYVAYSCIATRNSLHWKSFEEKTYWREAVVVVVIVAKCIILRIIQIFPVEQNHDALNMIPAMRKGKYRNLLEVSISRIIRSIQKINISQCNMLQQMLRNIKTWCKHNTLFAHSILKIIIV